MKKYELAKIVIKKSKWYKSHCETLEKLTPAQLDYLSNLHEINRPATNNFPIYGVVIANSENTCKLKVPYGGTLAIVIGYKDGWLVVKQSPTDDGKYLVRPDQVDLVGYRKGMTAKAVKKLVQWHEVKNKD